MNRKEWIEKIGDIIDAKDSTEFSNLLTEDGIFKFGNADEVKGRKNIADYVEVFFNMIKGSQHKVVNFWEQGDNVIWQGEVLYTRTDGKQVNVNFCNVFYMDGDLVEKYIIYIDNTPLFS
ncbi:MAG: nuclear transport factor 2 family protein [Candidatus Kapaibacterium sp.]